MKNYIKRNIELIDELLELYNKLKLNDIKIQKLEDKIKNDEAELIRVQLENKKLKDLVLTLENAKTEVLDCSKTVFIKDRYEDLNINIKA